MLTMWFLILSDTFHLNSNEKTLKYFKRISIISSKILKKKQIDETFKCILIFGKNYPINDSFSNQKNYFDNQMNIT